MGAEQSVVFVCVCGGGNREGSVTGEACIIAVNSMESKLETYQNVQKSKISYILSKTYLTI